MITNTSGTNGLHRVLPNVTACLLAYRASEAMRTRLLAVNRVSEANGKQRTPVSVGCLAVRLGVAGSGSAVLNQHLNAASNKSCTRTQSLN